MGVLVAVGATARFTGPVWGEQQLELAEQCRKKYSHHVLYACFVFQETQPTYQPTIMSILL